MVEILTAEEAAKKMKVSKRFIYKEIRKGRLSAFRMGDRSLRTTDENIAEYARSRTLNNSAGKNSKGKAQ